MSTRTTTTNIPIKKEKLLPEQDEDLQAMLGPMKVEDEEEEGSDEEEEESEQEEEEEEEEGSEQEEEPVAKPKAPEKKKRKREPKKKNGVSRSSLAVFEAMTRDRLEEKKNKRGGKGVDNFLSKGVGAAMYQMRHNEDRLWKGLCLKACIPPSTPAVTGGGSFYTFHILRPKRARGEAQATGDTMNLEWDLSGPKPTYRITLKDGEVLTLDEVIHYFLPKEPTTAGTVKSLDYWIRAGMTHVLLREYHYTHKETSPQTAALITASGYFCNRTLLAKTIQDQALYFQE